MWREAGRRGDRDSLLYRGRAQRGTETVFYTHGALYKQRSRVTGRRTRSDSDLKGGPQKGPPAHAHNILHTPSVDEVQGRGPVVLSLAGRSPVGLGVTRQTPPKSFDATFPPFVVYRACRRVEVDRDRHAQKAGCGGRAVAIDSAAVTRAQEKNVASYTRGPRVEGCDTASVKRDQIAYIRLRCTTGSRPYRWHHSMHQCEVQVSCTHPPGTRRTSCRRMWQIRSPRTGEPGVHCAERSRRPQSGRLQFG